MLLYDLIGNTKRTLRLEFKKKEEKNTPLQQFFFVSNVLSHHASPAGSDSFPQILQIHTF